MTRKVFLKMLSLSVGALSGRRTSSEPFDYCSRLAESTKRPGEREVTGGGVQPSNAWPRAGAERPAPLVARAEAQYFEVLGSKRAGKQFVQEMYLQTIGAAADPGSMPFWRELLEHPLERGPFKTARDELVLSALALLVVVRRDAAALALLLEACRNERPIIRGIAAQLAVLAHSPWVLARTSGAKEQGEEQSPWVLPPEVVARVREVADGKAVEERFLARRALENAGLDVTRDAPDGVFTFEVSPACSRAFKRVIEVLSSQTLHDLMLGILDSLGWDHDHLYEFRFGNDDGMVLPLIDFDFGSAEEAIGDLGLVRGCKFTLLYDMGDCHRFDLRLVSIAEKRMPETKYPRVAGRVGASPTQYPEW